MHNITSMRRHSLIWLTVLALGLPTLAVEGTQTSTEADPLLSKASYQDPQAGEFMTRWLLLGPIPASGDESAGEEGQKKAFKADPFSTERFRENVKVDEKEYEWTPVASEGKVVNLVKELGPETFATAYAWARVHMTKEKHVLLGIGSDDALKVWLNGELVHEVVEGRAHEPLADQTPITLHAGWNKLMLKIVQYDGGWGFSCAIRTHDGEPLRNLKYRTAPPKK